MKQNNLSRKIWNIHKNSHLKTRIIQSARPFICPFFRIIEIIKENNIDSFTLLDFGCGSGTLSNILGTQFKNAIITGFDTSKKAIKEAKKAKIVNSSFTSNLKGLDKNYDIICMIDVMHHIPVDKKKETLKFLISKLNKNGMFIYKDINHKNDIYSLWNRFHDFLMTGESISYLPIIEVESILKENNLKIIKKETHKMFLYHHELVVSKY